MPSPTMCCPHLTIFDTANAVRGMPIHLMGAFTTVNCPGCAPTEVGLLRAVSAPVLFTANPAMALFFESTAYKNCPDGVTTGPNRIEPEAKGELGRAVNTPLESTLKPRIPPAALA